MANGTTFEAGQPVRVRGEHQRYLPPAFNDLALFVYKAEPLSNGEVLVSTEDGSIMTSVPSRMLEAL